LPQQLANLLLPNNRPDIQPSTRQTKNVEPRSGDRSDTFERTLDRQIERQQPAKEVAEGRPDSKTQAAPNQTGSQEETRNGETPDTEELAGTEFTESEETADDDTTTAEGLTANPALVNTAAIPTRLETPGLTLAANKVPELNGQPAIPPVDETLPQAAPKEAVAGKSAAQNPITGPQTSDMFTRELAALNVESGSKQIAEEAKAQLASQSEGAKDSKNSGNLLQKAITEIAGLQNSPQNGLANATPNAAANTNLLNPTAPGGTTAEISQNIDELSITPQNAHGVSTKIGTAIQTNQSAQTAINTLAVQIAKQANLGVNRFQIRMDPPELGRIDVKLEFGRDGRMTANLTVERPETLDLLVRDARALERALAGSGLNTDKDSLNFSLKDQSTNEFSDFKRDAETGSNRSGIPDEDADLNSPLDKTIAAYRSLISSTAVDIRI